MEATSKKVLTYLTRHGRCPFDEWIDSLKDLQAVAQIQKRLIRVELGNLGDTKPVGGGVSEMRLQFGPGYRIYFGRRGREIVILLCWGR